MACVRRKRTKPSIAVKCSPTVGAWAAILPINSVLTSIAADLATFCAGFVTVLFPFLEYYAPPAKPCTKSEHPTGLGKESAVSGKRDRADIPYLWNS